MSVMEEYGIESPGVLQQTDDDFSRVYEFQIIDRTYIWPWLPVLLELHMVSPCTLSSTLRLFLVLVDWRQVLPPEHFL